MNVWDMCLLVLGFGALVACSLLVLIVIVSLVRGLIGAFVPKKRADDGVTIFRSSK